MYFKIVETKERGRPVLSIVPASWEKNGLLKWPLKHASLLCKSMETIPEENWLQMPCKIKRNYIPSYDDAEVELHTMLQMSETDGDSEGVVVTDGRKKRRVMPNYQNVVENFNEMAELCLIENTTENTQTNEITNETEITNVVTLDELNRENIEKIDLFDVAATDEPILNEVLRNQEIMMTQMAKLETMMDAILNKMSATNSNNISHITPAKRTPIGTLTELNKLEDILKDEEQMKKHIDDLSHICGTQGKGNGNDAAYQLIDILFDRSFLIKCSWCGGSKTDTEKISFKSYSNVMLLFYNLIRLADRDWTLNNCETFFKSILRNATRRSEATKQRMSKSKKRPKNLNYKAKHNNSNDNNTIENVEDFD